MIRNLKILIAAAMALAALGAIGASGAQAAEFQCWMERCTITVKPDGAPGPAGKTAHHVLIVKQGANSVSTTCQQVTGHATSAAKAFKTLTLTNIVYHQCNAAGESAVVRMNGCEYHYEVGGMHDATMQIECPTGKVIEKEVPATGCLITIGSTAVLGGGLTFHDAETNGIKKTDITVETKVTSIPVTVDNNKCAGGLKAGAATGEITTWNFELTAEEDNEPFLQTALWWE